MFLTGITIFLGLALLAAKLSRRTLLRALKHDALIDMTVTVLTLIVHWGTFSGVMAATVAGLLTSLATGALKHLFGYIDHSTYHVGRIRLDV
jgi:nucleoside permease NupC